MNSSSVACNGLWTDFNVKKQMFFPWKSKGCDGCVHSRVPRSLQRQQCETLANIRLEMESANVNKQPACSKVLANTQHTRWPQRSAGPRMSTSNRMLTLVHLMTPGDINNKFFWKLHKEPLSKQKISYLNGIQAKLSKTVLVRRPGDEKRGRVNRLNLFSSGFST